MTILVVVLAIFLLLLFGGMWLATACALLGLILMYLNTGWSNMLVASSWVIWTSVDNFPLVAVPLYIFMGVILTESGIAARMYTSLAPVLNRLPGGLLYANIAGGALFGAVSGSGTAAAATIGPVALPEMEKRKYPFRVSIGSIGAAASLDPIIPPSILMVFYGSITQTSIGRLFISGFIPGLILAGLYMLYISATFHFSKDWKEIRGELLPWKTSLRMTKDIWEISVLMVVVLGSIFAGIATPSESAAVGVVGSSLIALLHRRFTWRMMKRATIAAVVITCQLQFIYFGVQILSAAMARMGLITKTTQFFLGLPVPPFCILLIIFGIFVALGCLMETIPLLLMIVPVVFPTVTTLGYDPTWFGLIVTFLCVIGNITPPVGVVLFVLQSLRPGRTWDIYMGLTPFILMTILMLIIITVFPQIALWLPNLMLGAK